MIGKDDSYSMVLIDLTALIRSSLESLASEQWRPIHDDDSGYIEQRTKEVAIYRRLRRVPMFPGNISLLFKKLRSDRRALMPKPKVKKKSPKVRKTPKVVKHQFHSKHEAAKDIVKLSFKLPTALHARIKTAADAQERSVSHFITMKLSHLFPEPPKAVRTSKMNSAPDLEGLTS